MLQYLEYERDYPDHMKLMRTIIDRLTEYARLPKDEQRANVSGIIVRGDLAKNILCAEDPNVLYDILTGINEHYNMNNSYTVNVKWMIHANTNIDAVANNNNKPIPISEAVTLLVWFNRVDAVDIRYTQEAIHRHWKRYQCAWESGMVQLRIAMISRSIAWNPEAAERIAKIWEHVENRDIIWRYPNEVRIPRPVMLLKRICAWIRKMNAFK